MRRLDILVLIPLLAGGCTPAKERVSIDLSSVEAEPGFLVPETVVSFLTIPGRTSRLEDLPASRLYESLSSDVEAGIVEALEASRRAAFDRALESLRRQNEGLIAAELQAAQESIREADERDWTETSDELRVIFERFAPQEGRLRTRLLAMDWARRVRGEVFGLEAQLREQLREVPRENAVAWEKELEALKAEFQALIGPVMEAYLVRHEGRKRVPEELTAELRASLDEEARAIAASVVETTYAEMADFDAALSESLEPVEGRSAAMASSPGGRRRLEGLERGRPESAESLAALFVERNHFELVEPGPGVRDVTEEFQEWRKQYVIGP